jgi:hypothetical protein
MVISFLLPGGRQQVSATLRPLPLALLEAFDEAEERSPT